MRIGVMSDTHGNIESMQRAADLMVNEFEVEAIIHLGDDLVDTKKLDAHGVKLFAVPGIYEEAWNDKNIPHRIIKEFGGLTFLLSHTPKRERVDRKGDINPERASSRFGANVLLHGHTHSYRAVESADVGLIVINPGHLKGESDKDRPASFAVIDADREKLSVKFIGLSGETLEQSEFDIKLSIDDENEGPDEAEE